MEKEVRAIVAKHLNIEPESLKDDALLQDTVQDSIVLIGIVAELSDKLKLNIDPVKLNNVHTIGEAIKALTAMTPATTRPNY